MNKYPRNIKKDDKGEYPPSCLDLPGSGHFCFDQLTPQEQQSGYLSFDSALTQAQRECAEEIYQRPGLESPKSIEKEDLVFLGFFPHNDRKNRELSVVFGVALKRYSGAYLACDDFWNGQEKENIDLPMEPYEYDKLIQMWRDRGANKDKYLIHDGLGRLLGSGRLAGLVKNSWFEGFPELDITGHCC